MIVRFGVLTDLHEVQDRTRRAAWHNEYDFAGVEDRRRRALELFAEASVDRLLLLGDLAHDGDVPSLRSMLRPDGLGRPMLAVGGNHDGARPTNALARAGPESLALPGWRAVRHGPVRVSGLRIVRRSQGAWAAARPPALATWGGDPVLLASHFPLLSRATALSERRLPYAGDLIDRAAVAEPLTARAAPTVVACGHLHVRDSATEGSLLQLGLGALVEPPFEATVLELAVNGGAVEVTRSAHELGQAAERRDPRLAPARESWRFEPGRGWERRAQAAPSRASPTRGSASESARREAPSTGMSGK